MIKIGIIGVGAVGGMHKDAILVHPECELAAVCNRTLARAEELAKGTSARAYSDYKAMQESEKLDAVIINLPHHLHKDVSIYFLERGVAVLVEKPMANTVEECDAMIAAAKKSGAVFAVGHVQRYIASFRALKEIVQEERLGKLCSITEVRNANYFNPNRSAWFFDKKQAGGGLLMNFGAHTLDKLFYITGRKVKSVTAFGGNFLNDHNVEAHAQLLLDLGNGVSAAVTHIGCLVPGESKSAFYFTGGVAEVRGWDLWISEGGKPFEPVDCGDLDINFMEPQLSEFVKLLKGEENEMVSPEYGRDVIAVLEQAFNQIEKGDKK